MISLPLSNKSQLTPHTDKHTLPSILAQAPIRFWILSIYLCDLSHFLCSNNPRAVYGTGFLNEISSVKFSLFTQQGFGNLDGEYWLGLENLYWLTTQASYKLRVHVEDWQGRQAFAEYDSFYIEPESDWYRLRLGSYQGTAGDSLSWHSNKAFTTLDRDNDAYSGSDFLKKIFNLTLRNNLLY